MRRFIHSLAGVAVLAGAASAQFAAQAAPSALTPVPQTTAPQPATAHPWYVKPESGQWMICVKSYTDQPGIHTARMNAEALITEIRERYPTVPAYLFERGALEREQERARHNQELAKQRAIRAQEEAAFNAIQEKAKAEALAKGMEFIDSRPQIRAATVQIQEQYAVLIGGWPTMEAARKELEKIRRWDPPRNKNLMDGEVVANEGKTEMAYINPFKTGMVVPNPVAPRPLDPEGEALAKFVVSLNANEEYSVLKIKKNWTIAVKQFTPPQQIKDNDGKSIVARLFSDSPDVMDAAKKQAKSMVSMLRTMKPTRDFPYGPYEAYVLHTKNGSLVCVGQFDGPDDPKMLEIQSQLGMIKFDVRDSKDPTHSNQQGVRLFDRLYAMRVR